MAGEAWGDAANDFGGVIVNSQNFRGFDYDRPYKSKYNPKTKPKFRETKKDYLIMSDEGHTYDKWLELGYQVKRGEKAAYKYYGRYIFESDQVVRID
jgi:hypothetical protein